MAENNSEQDVLKVKAEYWWKLAYEAQTKGNLDEAIRLYSHSIEIYPTAEAYTFRGWAMSYQGRLDEAIAECHKAIETDPDFGNPYNDIGAYLIQKGDYVGAIPWLKQALQTKRYECYFYPHFNLARIYEKQHDLIRAMNHYKAAYELNHNYAEALKNLRRLQSRLN